MTAMILTIFYVVVRGSNLSEDWPFFVISDSKYRCSVDRKTNEC